MTTNELHKLVSDGLGLRSESFWLLDRISEEADAGGENPDALFDGLAQAAVTLEAVEVLRASTTGGLSGAHHRLPRVSAGRTFPRLLHVLVRRFVLSGAEK